MPGSGFIAAQEIPKNQQDVFAFDWLRHKPPTPEMLANACKVAAIERPA
jgi:hypothetical protein